MGRSAAGVKGIDLNGDNEVIGAVRVPMYKDKDGDLMTTAERNRCLLTITEHGYGKRTPVDEYRVQPETGKPRSQSRGGKGRTDIRVTERNGRSVAVLSVETGDDIVVITRKGQLVRTSADSIRETGRATQGVRVVRLNEGDSVVAAARVIERDDGDAETGDDAHPTPKWSTDES